MIPLILIFAVIECNAPKPRFNRQYGKSCDEGMASCFGLCCSSVCCACTSSMMLLALPCCIGRELFSCICCCDLRTIECQNQAIACSEFIEGATNFGFLT